jgi:hypothetical protein
MAHKGYYTQRLPEEYGRDLRLGRHIEHDPRSLLYPHRAVPGGRRPIKSVRWARTAPALDQGELGSCTGNAMTGALLTAPFGMTGLDEQFAVRLYSQATKLDDVAGEYPPIDTGSSGLAVAKAAKAQGLISGYRHATSLLDALDALMDGPVITGVAWYENMFTPDGDGEVRIGGAVAGGHEFEVFGVDEDLQRVWCWQSWGSRWGLNGTFYLNFSTWGDLLDDNGDVTVPIPLSQPAPAPLSSGHPAADALADAILHKDWYATPHVGGNARVARAAGAWLTEEGYLP